MKPTQPVKSFEEFRNELHEARKMNEGVLDKIKSGITAVKGAIKGALEKIGEFFSGFGASFLNSLILQSKGDLPEGIKFYPKKSDVELLKANGVKIEIPKVNENNSFEEYYLSTINEAEVALEHPNPEIDNVGVKEFKESLRDVVESGAKGTPLLIWGAPGIGKTAIIGDVAKEYFGPNADEEQRIIEVDLMSSSAEDFFMPAVTGRDEKGNLTPDAKGVRLPTGELPLYHVSEGKAGNDRVNGPDGEGGIIFFDEIARAPQRVQNVCLKLIDQRRVGSYVLGDKWVIIAAANREGDDDSGTFAFSSALGNRFRQINYAPKFEDWNEWASKAEDEAGDFIVSREILAFVKFNHDKYFYHLDPEVKSSTGGVNTIFPTPRAWTNASKALKTREKRAAKEGRALTNDEREKLVAQLVGKDAASAFIGFLKLMKKFNPEDIKNAYDNPAKAPTFAGLQIDEKNALIASVVFQRQKDKLDDKHKMNFIDWLISLGKDERPFVMKAMAMIQEVHPYLKDDDFWEQDCKGKLFDTVLTDRDKEKLS